MLATLVKMEVIFYVATDVLQASICSVSKYTIDLFQSLFDYKTPFSATLHYLRVIFQLDHGFVTVVASKAKMRLKKGPYHR